MEAVFLKILNMSFSAALVIVVVLLARLALRRAPKKWSYLLWLVVAFRLCCPVSISAPFSVLRLTARPAVVTERAAGAASEIAYIPQDIGDMAQPRVYVGTPRVSEVISDALPAPQVGDSANPLQIWTAVGTALWCAGMAALLCYGVISYLRLRRRLTGAVAVEQGVCETDAVRAPFILGLVRPTVYLPVGLEGETLRYVLAHERFHIRRGDHAVKLLGFLLLTLHWFNPLVWLAFALMSRDMEMRCDEAVLSAESGITKPYSMALLSFATQRRFPSPSPLCFGETGVKERIKNVLRWRSPKTWVTVAAALLCLAAVAACAVNPSKKETIQGTPYDWTSTVRLSDVKGFAEGNGLTLRYTQMQELIRLLNAVKPEEVVRGRGIPSDRTLDITTGVGYRLRWGGGVIELDFDDAAAAAELYGSPETNGPGVWEIHNDALYAFLESLGNETKEAQPTAELIADALNSDGAMAEQASHALLERLIAAPSETLQAVGARPSGIRSWLCWTLASEIKTAMAAGEITDLASILSGELLRQDTAAAWDEINNYVNQDLPAPKSWRQVYRDFFNDTLLPQYAAAGSSLKVYGVSLMDIDFDAVPELMVWEGVASAAAFGMLWQTDGAQVTRATGDAYSTNILTGRMSAVQTPLAETWAFWLVRERETGAYYWAVHSGNGQDDRVWGGYRVFDAANTAIVPDDYESKADQAAAWEAFRSRYEILDVDYSDFTLSIYRDGEIDGAAFNALLNRWRPLRVFTKDGAQPASGSDLYGADTLDWGPNLSPDGHMLVRRYAGDGWSVCIPVSGWTQTEASGTRSKWTSDADTGSTLVVRRASAAEYAAERPKLADGQAETWFPAQDGGYWLVFTQYDPKLLIDSSWRGKEPELLERMAESFVLTGGGATPVTEGIFDKKLRETPMPVYVEVVASGAPRTELQADEIRTLWEMYRGLTIVSESRKLPADWEDWGDTLWVVQFWDDPGQQPCGISWHIYPDNRVYVYRSTEAQVYAECVPGSIDYAAVRAIYENRRIIERSPEDVAAAFTAARAWCAERGITLQTLWYDPVDDSDWTIFRIARERFTRGADYDEHNHIELYCEGTWPENVTGATTISLIRLSRESSDSLWKVIDHGNGWTPTQYSRTRHADQIIYG